MAQRGRPVTWKAWGYRASQWWRAIARPVERHTNWYTMRSSLVVSVVWYRSCWQDKCSHRTRGITTTFCRRLALRAWPVAHYLQISMHAAYKAGATLEEILEVLHLVGDWTGVSPSGLVWRPGGRHAALLCTL